MARCLIHMDRILKFNRNLNKKRKVLTNSKFLKRSLLRNQMEQQHKKGLQQDQILVSKFKAQKFKERVQAMIFL